MWFRLDLRLADNPALAHAAARGEPVIPLFIRDDADAAHWRPGGASQWWLHGSLESLDRDLRARSGGQGLMLRTGCAEQVIADVLAESGARAIVWNSRYEPWAVRRDAGLKSALRAQGVEVRTFNAALLMEPARFPDRPEGPYKVFTPFWRALRAKAIPPPACAKPARILPPASAPGSETLGDWRLRPSRPDWARGLAAEWSPGEPGAANRVEAFVDGAMRGYGAERNIPSGFGTSRLSPHLHFGEIGPWQVWREVTTAAAAAFGDPFHPDAERFLAELAWREFSHHLLFHFTDMPTAPLKAEYSRFPWRDDEPALAAWRAGRTGYPIVDAGLRQLWSIGWMHNRVRMIAASFLIKHLLIDWRRGEEWFWDTLVDADLANNSASWQWVAGSGADAAPYFRIFNPVSQGLRFDPDGAYVRAWVPELARLPSAVIHAPWTASVAQLEEAGVRLGADYPRPWVDHALARARALEAYGRIKATA